MPKGLAIFYLASILLAMLAASASSLGSNNCFNIIHKRRRSVKSIQDDEVQLASHRQGDKLTQTLDESVKSKPTSMSRSPPLQKGGNNGWTRMLADSVARTSSWRLALLFHVCLFAARCRGANLKVRKLLVAFYRKRGKISKQNIEQMVEVYHSKGGNFTKLNKP
jgi:hypothetical protein